MAQHASAKQRIRRNERRTLINRNRVSRIRTHVKKVEQAIESGDRADAVEAFRAAQPELHRGVTKGVLKKNTVNRRLSRLSARIKVMS
ncbi:MAG: 30S ribosomal protein S20 [Alphaproteobacteria bacterium]|jgi:small subunit ribosomal protein S20|nr:30S ribosomal protein S20 [Alphaproteobacteria bacterium]